MIKGLLVRPGCAPEVIEFENSLAALQEIVEGYIEMPYIFDDCQIVINEEGKLNGSLPNKNVYVDAMLSDTIYGNILVVDIDDEGETISLSDEKIEEYKKILSRNAIYLYHKCSD